MKTAKLDTSGSVSTNDQIVAIGNALGHFGTPTAVDGIVTGTHRTITAGDDNANTETLSDMIQIQADIQPGDSGGPIVDADAEVIGVTTAADAGSGRFGFRAGNTGFAIPIAKAMGVARKIEAGTATDRIHIGGNRALLGVLLDDQAGGLGDRSSGDGAPSPGWSPAAPPTRPASRPVPPSPASTATRSRRPPTSAPPSTPTSPPTG